MGSTIGLLLAGFAAYWVYTDAKSRGNSRSYCLLWAVGTFAVLFIFLPLYLLFGRKAPKREQPERLQDPNTIDVEATAVAEADMTCPMCGNPSREADQYCSACGNALKPRCGNCGRPLQREWTECPDCQTPVGQK
ncbi:MAG: zinc ribbon domain-containing protein [Sporomusaceae bacterium]|nr:zinc ribbon domain-containing protein [Sporomusaceae bacterium]